jgi:hypothetical protein
VLESRVVDQDIGADVEAVDGGEVGEVGLPGPAADRVGDRLGGVAVESRTVTAAPASASRWAQASPTPLAAPVTRALRPVKSTPAAAVRALAVLI